MGCGSTASRVGDGSAEEEGASTAPIVDVDHSSVKRQSIGNCWLYAVGSWAESLNKAATGVELDTSESYLTYWHWFEQIANRRASSISTGGTWSTGVDLMSRYGVMLEGDFIPEELGVERSIRQRDALAAINESLKTGALATSVARSDRATIRAELDRVFNVSATVKAELDTVFGAGVVRTLDRSTSAAVGSHVMTTRSIAVKTTDPLSRVPVTVTLADVIGTPSSWGAGRGGRYAWQSASYPTSASSRRNFWKRMQRAMHDQQPVVISWRVDFNALDATGNFAAPPTEPGRQGGHLVVVEDYEIDNVPGYGTLPAGTPEARPAALSAALADSATIKFLRIKNSWGSTRPGPFLGYNDLYTSYLNGPIKSCETDASDEPLEPFDEHCWDATPLQAMTLPPGY